jgi:hypothetical protein
MTITQEVDDFGKIVMSIAHKEQLLQGLEDFLVLANENGIGVDEKISFLGEYQKGLVEGVMLRISIILFDKEDGKNSRMQLELDSVEKRLNEDIMAGKADCNYTVPQKEATLAELKEIRDSKEYRNAIASVKTARNTRVAHMGDYEFSKNGLTFEKLKLVIKNIIRCYKIRQLVMSNVGEVSIKSAAGYDHRNLVEALVLQSEIQILKDEYHKNGWTLQDKWYSSNLEFWSEIIKPKYTDTMGVN